MAANMSAADRRRMDESLAPSFKTKDGLKGMECGIRTGLPGFAVFQYNPTAMFNAFEECETASECHSRNFISEICPTPCTFKWKRKHMMTIFRMSHGSYADWGDNLIWNKFVYPHVEISDDGEEEDEKQ